MRTLFTILISAAVLTTYAQTTTFDSTQAPTTEQAPVAPKKKSSVKDKIYYGGYVNMSFGSYTMIGVEPMIGYKLTPKLSAGIKIRYDYINDKRYSQSHTTSNYGGSVFARYRVIPALYLHVENAYYSYELYDIFGNSEREWVPFLFVGAGYSQSLGGRTWLNVQVLFDVWQHSNSPYSDWEPFYSVGIGVGF